MVTANGFPKSGNHALVKALQLLGIPCEVNHIPFGGTVSGTHVFIKRDPRNIVCSWLRFTGQEVSPGTFIASFRKFQGSSLVAEMFEYEGWLSDPWTKVIKYEDLIASNKVMWQLADYLVTPYLYGAFELLPGLTKTWHVDHSDYKKLWIPEVDKVWNSEGGKELLLRWGYGD